MSGLQNLILGYGRPRNDYVEIRRESPVPVTSKGAQGHAHTPRISNVYHPVRVPTTIKTLNLPYNPENPFEQARRDARAARNDQKEKQKELKDRLNKAEVLREQKILKDRTIGQRARGSPIVKVISGERGRVGSHDDETRGRRGRGSVDDDSRGRRAPTSGNGGPAENRSGILSHRSSRRELEHRGSRT